LGKDCIAYDGVWVTPHWVYLVLGIETWIRLGRKVGYMTWTAPHSPLFLGIEESWDGIGHITMIPRVWARRFKFAFACLLHVQLAASRLQRWRNRTKTHLSIDQQHISSLAHSSHRRVSDLLLFSSTASPSRLRCHTHCTHVVSETKALPGSRLQEHCPVRSRSPARTLFFECLEIAACHRSRSSSGDAWRCLAGVRIE
jgi:hypothetical protein